jgi:TRAP-type C4-dicarboxylate transport system substrate-binding protein
VVEAGQEMQATLASINAISVIVKSELLFADKARAKTNGGLDIKVVYGGALGGMKENFEVIMANSLEFAQVNNAFLGEAVDGPNTFTGTSVEVRMQSPPSVPR